MHVHTPKKLLLIHVVVVKQSQWFKVTNLVYYNDIHGLANGCSVAMLKCSTTSGNMSSATRTLNSSIASQMLN